MTHYFFGFSLWKRSYITPFFPTKDKKVFSSSLSFTFKYTIKKSDSHFYIWGKKSFPTVEKYAMENNIPLFRIEDGFVRSVSLGSDLTKAYSLVIDKRGIYFDPTHESDLEYLLSTYSFKKDLIVRSQNLQNYLLNHKISKYNIYQDKKLTLDSVRKNQIIILVPGQVEDDASIIYGAQGMNNLTLLQKVRECAPSAYIIYKPHPDVLVGNRKGHIEDSKALQYCDTIITNVSLDSVLEIANEVHTMTSLVGFEALIRKKHVYTYGLPFYAGWGLTTDREKCKRRKRLLTLDELVAVTMILYPKYLHPKLNILCEIEVVLTELNKEKIRYNTNTFYKLFKELRHTISRKIQLLIKVLFQ